MKHWTDDYQIRTETKRLVSSHSLKRCPLCGAVNAVANDECFVGCWHGEFDTNPGSITEGVNQLLVHNPDLANALIDRAASTQKRKGWFGRLVVGFAVFLRSF